MKNLKKQNHLIYAIFVSSWCFTNLVDSVLTEESALELEPDQQRRNRANSETNTFRGP